MTVTDTTLVPERSEADNFGDLTQRIARVAAIAAADADNVDREARFPHAAIAAAKANKLLGALVPREFGGEQASIFDVTEMCYTLGRACSSTAMIIAMHHVKVACVVRHGRGNAWQESFMRRIASEQMLLASSTTEGQNGGNVRSSAAAIEHNGNTLSLERDATVISYGAEADGLVTVARRAADAAASDQVLLALAKSDYTLERTTTWDTLGMRGTCSTGFALKARGVADQIVPEPYDRIHAQTMVPYAHLCWSSVWAGIASAAVMRAQAFIRKAARGANGQLPPGAAHFTEAQANLNKLRAMITATADMYAAREFDERTLGALDFQSAINLLKVEASELAGDIVMCTLRATGLSGYRNDGSSSMARQLRDVLSAPLMINNDRIRANIATATLMGGGSPRLRD
jgi:acyl-CoA dehydrogenase